MGFFHTFYPSTSRRCESRRNSLPRTARQVDCLRLCTPYWVASVNAFSSPGRSAARPGVNGQSHGGIDEMGMGCEPRWPRIIHGDTPPKANGREECPHIRRREAQADAPQIAIPNMRLAGPRILFVTHQSEQPARRENPCRAASITAGRTEMRMIATTTMVKLRRTMGMLPKK